ncbi:MAG: ATP-dependent helicase, partial [Bifidobacterium castoris]|nr:ATP-dependent helicase [Bifidobacterium castoris]
LLDRYGVITQPVVDHEGVPGGFSGLYPVLRRMEEQGALMRGMFVDGFGAAQFARRETVDMMRDLIGRSPATVALDAADPAVLYGTAIRWPGPMRMAGTQNEDGADDADDAASTGGVKPTRRAGSVVGLRGGDGLLYPAPRSGRVVKFEEPTSLSDRALEALADMLRRLPGGSVTFRDCNGVPLTARLPVTPALRAAGFAPSPQGMKLYR